MLLTLTNLTGSARTYVSGTISVPANSSLAITSTTQQVQLATDGALRSDVFSANATITDGTNTFGGQDAVTYLYQILQAIGTNSDGSGNPITSIADGNGTFALEIAQGATSFAFSSGNTSTAQLAANATFTGNIDNIINQQSYSILLTSDQNGTLTLNQFIDAAGSHLSQQIVIPISAGIGFSRSGVINGNYFQIKFQNTGSAATTTLNINTYYGTIPSSTQLNNAPVAINEINGVSVTPYNGQLETADIINTSLSSGSVAVSTTAVAARVGASNLASRKMLTISPVNGTVYFGATSGVTTSTGIPIFQNQVISFAFSANITPYLIAASSITVNLMEGA